MAQCIIYARVSTRGQAWGYGIVRQIECCQQRAKNDGVFVRSVYVDVCSGGGLMPNRDRAIAEAYGTGYPIYAESIDRWTRQGDDETLDDDALNLVFCSRVQAEFESRLGQLFDAYIQQEAKDGR